MMDSGQLFLIPAPRLVRADHNLYPLRNYLASRNIQSESIKGRAILLKVEAYILVIWLLVDVEIFMMHTGSVANLHHMNITI